VRYCLASYKQILNSSVRFSVVFHHLTAWPLNDEEQFYDQKIKKYATQ